MMRVSEICGNKVYNLSAGKSTPQFAEERAKKKKRRKGGGGDARVGDDDEEFRNRVDLLHHFEFAISSQCIRVSHDGRYIGVTGIYPPELRVFDVQELGMKFSRGFDTEIKKFEFLSDDYRKIVFLQENRQIVFHSQGGHHHLLRIPKEGRDMEYCKDTAQLMIVGSCNEIFRIDLEAGEFDASLISSKCDEQNAIFCNPVLPIFSVCGPNGVLESWDWRSSRSVSTLKVNPRHCFGSKRKKFSSNGYDELDEDDIPDLTSGSYSSDGFYVSLGNDNGEVFVYDIRCGSRPLFSRNHRNSKPITKVSFVSPTEAALGLIKNKTTDHQFIDGIADCEDGGDVTGEGQGHSRSDRIGGSEEDDCGFIRGQLVASTDGFGVKIWKGGDDSSLPPGSSRSKIYAAIEAFGGGDIAINSRSGAAGNSNSGISVINDFSFYPNSGLLFTASEQPRVGVYLLPCIGGAPRWASFLDSMTEELEEASLVSASSPASTSTSLPSTRKQIYDDFKFITRQQLEQMGLSHLIGTPILRAYMHGYFVNAKLYDKLMAVVTPFDFEEYRKEKMREKIAKNKPMRVQILNKPSKLVNADFAAKLEKTAAAFEKADQQERGPKKQRQISAASEILNDERFSRLFSNPDFIIESTPSTT